MSPNPSLPSRPPFPASPPGLPSQPPLLASGTTLSIGIGSASQQNQAAGSLEVRKLRHGEEGLRHDDVLRVRQGQPLPLGTLPWLQMPRPRAALGPGGTLTAHMD